MPRRNKDNEIIFSDYPEFKPNLRPKEMFHLGSFGGTYWRPIDSKFYEIVKDRFLLKKFKDLRKLKIIKGKNKCVG